MYGKIQRMYWKFTGWLYLNHPEVFDAIKKLFPKSLKNVIKRALVRDRSKIQKKEIISTEKREKISVSAFCIGDTTKTDLLKNQTVFSLIKEIKCFDNLAEAFVYSQNSNTIYSFFFKFGDEIDVTALEKAIICLEERLDKHFVILNGINYNQKSSVGALSVSGYGLLSRSLIRNDFIKLNNFVQNFIENKDGYFFHHLLNYGRFMPETLYEGVADDNSENVYISHENYEWGNDHSDLLGLIKKYKKEIRKNKIIINQSKPFRGLEKIKKSKGEKPRILFVVPWTVIGGSDKVILDLLVKLKEFGKYETVVATTFDVSHHIGLNLWEESFKDNCDHFYPGYSFCNYDNRGEMVEYLAKTFDPELMVISNSGHGYEIADSISVPVVDIHHGDLFMRHSSETKNVSRHIAVSDFVSGLLVEKWGIKKEKIVNIPNGVDENIFSISNKKTIGSTKRKELGVNKNEKLLLYLGRLAPEKNPIMSLKVLKGVLESGINAKLVIVGDGPERESLEIYVVKNNLENYVIFEGFKNNTADYFSAADVFILPSTKEAFGIVAIEAIMSGTPVVASNVGELPKIIAEGKDGFVAEVNNVKDFIEKVKKCLNLKIESVSSEILGKYSLTKTSTMYIKVFEETMKGKRRK